MEINACCFIGHRKINETEELNERVYTEIERLITEEKVDTFLFGSRNDFNYLCLDIVTEIKEKYPHVKRIYVRAEYPYISDSYRQGLLDRYDDTYYPEHIIDAGRAVYVERNYEMIDKSKFCVIYYDENYSPKNRKSGTKIALEYAIKKKRIIIKF